MKQGDASGRGRVPVKVKKDRGRSQSSRAWLKRQLNDPYVAAAKAKGYRSRAAFKLIELNEKFRFLKKGARVLDLGAAPGGWSQVAAQKGAIVVAADVLAIDPLPGVHFFRYLFAVAGAGAARRRPRLARRHAAPVEPSMKKGRA